MTDELQKFNASGLQGRDCPLCFRTGTLAGARDGDAPRLSCTGCFTEFELTWSSDPRMPNTLTRIRTPIRQRPRAFELKP